MKWLAVLLASLLILTLAVACGEDGDGEPSPTGSPSPASADLEVSAIEVLPAQPQAGVTFAVNVSVQNVGQAQSGEYDLDMFIKDVSRDLTYPVGTFRREGVQPGDEVVAYTSTDMVNDPGSYQVHVEIKPFLWEDGNPQNKTAIWAFTAE